MSRGEGLGLTIAGEEEDEDELAFCGGLRDGWGRDECFKKGWSGKTGWLHKVAWERGVHVLKGGLELTRAGEEEGGVAGWLGEGWGIDHTAGEGLTHTHPKAPLANSAWRARTVPRPRSSASCPPPPSDASTPTPQVLPSAQEYRSKNHSKAPRECQRVHCGVRGAAAHSYTHARTRRWASQ